jgi:hypothetical protein
VLLYNAEAIAYLWIGQDCDYIGGDVDLQSDGVIMRAVHDLAAVKYPTSPFTIEVMRYINEY